MRLAGPTPAQLTRMRAGPCASAAFFTAASPLAPSATSQAIATPLMSLAISAAAFSLMSRTATRAPAAASARAVAAPSPDPPPVTIAACPLMSITPSLCRAAGASVRQCDSYRRQRRRVQRLDQRGAVLQHGALVDRALVGRLAF